MKLVVTIDTEEDNWVPYAKQECSARNIERLPVLQEVFDEFGVRPTYLVSYQVAQDAKAVKILREIVHSGRCEIGTHCHPWNTPPYGEERTMANTMLFNLPPELQYRKICTVHETVQDCFGITPTSFRSGRWGYGSAVAEALVRLGYKTDTSITAYTDWANCGGPDYSHVGPEPYWFKAENIYERCASGDMLEIPATVGYFQSNFGQANAIYNRIRKSPLKRIKLLGVLERLGLLNKVWLSPENSTAAQMKHLTLVMQLSGHNIANMFFHTPDLVAGLTPFTPTEEAVTRFIAQIREYLTFVRELGIETITLSEARSVMDGSWLLQEAAGVMKRNGSAAV